MLVMMLATSVALLLSGSALLWSELRDFRGNLEASITTMARIVSSNSVAAISFDDENAAAETLLGLKTEPQILAAGIYRENGGLFAQYVRKGTLNMLPPAPGPDGCTNSGERMILVSGVFDGRERRRVGSIYIVADCGGIRERIKSYAGLLALVLLTSALVALALSAMLQRYISAPILRLAGATERVANQRDYSIRVPAGANDELGKLIASFNAMLGQIESQDAALHRAQDLLEKRVQERTVELQTEVGERRRVEEEQAHSLSLVNATLEATADGILVVDGYGRIVSCNAKFAEMWRIPRHLLAPHDDRRLVEFVSSQLKDAQAFMEKIEWLYSHPEEKSYDSIEFLDGRVFERYSMPQKIGGISIGRVWSFRDISDRTRSEECIREQASLLNLAQDAIVVRDMDDEILFWSTGAERVFGWKCEEALANRMQTLLQSDAAKLGEAKRAVLDRGDWTGDLRHTTKAGREVVTESRWTLLRDPLGAPKSILMINTDVTERKKLELQFLRSQRLESLGTLAGGIAHDLNNVLAPILVSIELLRSEFDNPDADQILEAVQLSAQRGADLVSQILCFARGAEGKRVVIQPALVIKEVFKIARDTFPKNIEVRCTVPPDVWSVCGDATQLHQVLLNLCVNARDAMPDGGALTIEVENIVCVGSAESLKVSPAAGPHLVFRVRDTGSGIPAEAQEKIFEPFFTTKDVGHGTGLGLSTASAIVKGHEGMIDFETSSKGTTFTVCIPALPNAAKQKKPEEALRPEGHQELVLLVDDEASVRLVVKQTLENFQYRVITAPDGATAISLFKERRNEISVVLTDMMMPGMDGADTIAALKAIDPNVRVVAASGLMTDERMLRATAAGAVAFLRKPFSAEAMLRTLRQVLVGTGADNGLN